MISFDLLLVFASLATIQVFLFTAGGFLIEPPNQTAVVGSEVTLCCRVFNRTGKLTWIKDGVAVRFLMDLPGYETYKTSQDIKKGDFCLNINHITLKDEGWYRCRMNVGPETQPLHSETALVTVLIPPEPPEILQGTTLVTLEDRQIELECVSMAGKPAAEITWVDGYGKILTENISNFAEPLVDGRRFTVKSTLRLTPQSYDNNTFITCRAQNLAEQTHQLAKLKLVVEYAPKVYIIGLEPSGPLLEGSNVILTCQSSANPPDMTYKWFINNENVQVDSPNQLIIQNITRTFNKAVVRCRVENAVGQSEDLKTLKVNYGPKFLSKPKSIQADLGTVVTLLCDADANPPANITWIHKDTDKVVGRNPHLRLTVDSDTIGDYYCVASNAGFPEIKSATAAVSVWNIPDIHLSLFVIVLVLVITTTVISLCFSRKSHRKRPVISVHCNGNQKTARNASSWIYKTEANEPDVRIKLVCPDNETEDFKMGGSEAPVRLESFGSLPRESSKESEKFNSLPKNREVRRAQSFAAPGLSMFGSEGCVAALRKRQDLEVPRLGGGQIFPAVPGPGFPTPKPHVQYSEKDLRYLEHLDLRYSTYPHPFHSHSTKL